jgi:hypothetical protein
VALSKHVTRYGPRSGFPENTNPSSPHTSSNHRRKLSEDAMNTSNYGLSCCFKQYTINRQINDKYKKYMIYNNSKIIFFLNIHHVFMLPACMLPETNKNIRMNFQLVSFDTCITINLRRHNDLVYNLIILVCWDEDDVSYCWWWVWILTSGKSNVFPYRWKQQHFDKQMMSLLFLI